jgi:hypothetical protein
MLITSYFNIDRACLLNLVPKLIVHQLVKDVEFRLHDKLVKELFRSREYNIKDLLQESRLVAEERKECQKKIKVWLTFKS